MGDAILLAMNGSEAAHSAARHAVDLAAERDATLHVLCVVDQRVHDEPGLSSAELVTIEAEDHGHDCIATATGLAADAGVDVEGAVRHGVPADLVLEYAAEVDADLIVVGEHGDHGHHLGGVGREVEARSEREVVVVRADQSPATEHPE